MTPSAQCRCPALRRRLSGLWRTEPTLVPPPPAPGSRRTVPLGHRSVGRAFKSPDLPVTVIRLQVLRALSPAAGLGQSGSPTGRGPSIAPSRRPRRRRPASPGGSHRAAIALARAVRLGYGPVTRPGGALGPAAPAAQGEEGSFRVGQVEGRSPGTWAGRPGAGVRLGRRPGSPGGSLDGERERERERERDR